MYVQRISVRIVNVIDVVAALITRVNGNERKKMNPIDPVD